MPTSYKRRLAIKEMMKLTREEKNIELSKKNACIEKNHLIFIIL